MLYVHRFVGEQCGDGPGQGRFSMDDDGADRLSQLGVIAEYSGMGGHDRREFDGARD